MSREGVTCCPPACRRATENADSGRFRCSDFSDEKLQFPEEQRASCGSADKPGRIPAQSHGLTGGMGGCSAEYCDYLVTLIFLTHLNIFCY